MSFEANEEEPEGRESSPSVAVESRHSIAKRVRRPASRRLFKQQLAAQDKNKKDEMVARTKEEKWENAAARRGEKTAVRQRANVPKEAAKSKHTKKKAKLTNYLDGEEDGLEKAYVLIDLTGIDVKEYERLSD